MTKKELKEFLDEKVVLYNHPNFIESDPIQIPHRYQLKEDIEISGFLAATISWGNRKMIIKNGLKLMDLLGNSPYDFIMNHTDNQLEKVNNFVHRTFNGIDCVTFIKGLKNIYENHSGLEAVFAKNQQICKKFTRYTDSYVTKCEAFAFSTFSFHILESST